MRPFSRLMLIASGLTCAAVTFSADTAVPVNPSAMPATGTVDKRFQAYNVEMLEVTGGRFWKPYKDLNTSAAKTDSRGSASIPAGMNPDLYMYRPPIDLINPRLRKLAAALGPTYVRVSGTWANTTYFQTEDGPPPATPPTGFNGILTRQQWKSVIDFAHAANAEIITSFSTGAGVRNAEGVWAPGQARAFLAYTKSAGGTIAAAEFMNEPNLAIIGGAPKGYNAAAYAKDLDAFRPFLKETSPGTLLIGPGSVAEGKSVLLPPNLGFLHTEDLLKATGPIYDAFSYHLYPAVSERCASMSPTGGTTAAAALSAEWLARADTIHDFYAGLRDLFEPGKPLWITETADASCGGNRWGATFLDTFRYLDEHGRLARQGVQVIAHNTLAASDYGLLDENGFAPRPNYWAALLWHKLMGTTVLKTNAPQLYAHCLNGVPGGVSLLAINTDRSASMTLTLPTPSERYTMSAPNLEGTRVDLNGKELKLGPRDSLPPLKGVRAPSGRVTLPPATVTFLAVSEAHNANCH